MQKKLIFTAFIAATLFSGAYSEESTSEQKSNIRTQAAEMPDDLKYAIEQGTAYYEKLSETMKPLYNPFAIVGISAGSMIVGVLGKKAIICSLLAGTVVSISHLMNPRGFDTHIRPNISEDATSITQENSKEKSQ